MNYYNAKFLRWKMEQVWNTPGCACPSHLANWSTFERGFRFYNTDKTSILLWFKRGKLLRPKKTKS